MEILRQPFDVILFVCANIREDERASCGARGSAAIHQELKRRVKSLNTPGRVRVSQSGCLDLCSQGPVVLAFPAGRLYTGVTLDDIDRILGDLFGPDAVPGERLA